LPTPDHRVVSCLRHLAEAQIQRAGPPLARGAAILVPAGPADIAARVGLGLDEVTPVLARLASARLVLAARDAGLAGEGFVVPEVGRLLEFLEFLNLRDRYGG
ncbi:MAG TPA: hypothetical protein VFT22_28240, partial [Kofleriaceae bacterium]|nr:hypothetical protein [Kofleriaceae bacterium]